MEPHPCINCSAFNQSQLCKIIRDEDCAYGKWLRDRTVRGDSGEE